MTTLRLLLIFFLSLHLANGLCPSGSDIVRDGECRGNYTRINTYSEQAAQEAISICREAQGQPIIIHNEEDQLYWRGRISPTGYTVIGMVCDSNSKKWVWADDSAVDYKSSQLGADLDDDCTTYYSGMTWMMTASGIWTYYANHTSWSTDVFCTTQLRQPDPDGCVDFEDFGNGLCYQIGTTAENWPDAQAICATFGANLASIHTPQENSFLRRLATARGAVNGLMLGAVVSLEDGHTFKWIDGSDMDYENFYPGFPMPDIGGACLAMDTTNPAGQWMNMDCQGKLPVACIREKGKVTVPTCKAGALRENTLILSPGFPFNASTPCDFFLTVDKAKIVEVEILFLEANSCCDVLTIHDDFLGGALIASLTGEVQKATFTSTSNLVRVSWKPNGGVNVIGVAMTFRGV